MSPILSTFTQKNARQAQISILVAIDGYPKTEMRCHWDDKKIDYITCRMYKPGFMLISLKQQSHTENLK